MDGQTEQRVFRCGVEWVGDGSAVVSVAGELDVATSGCLRDLLSDLRARGIGDHLVVDLTACSFVDSTGLGVLVTAQRVAKARLNLVLTRPELIRLLQLTALDLVFAIHPTREAALETLRRQVGEL
jgi:anti-sigma B factor antagonist